MNLQEIADYGFTDGRRFEDTPFYKWFWQMHKEGKLNKDYQSPWAEVFKRNSNAT